MNILVTGSGTLLGNSVSRFLAKKGFNIISTYRKSYPSNLKKKNIIIKKINLNKKNIKINFKVDCLVHCASAIPSYNLKDDKMFKSNVKGFRNLLEECLKRGCKKIILISSMSVYGKIKKQVNLKTQLRPRDTYGKSKLLNEKDIIKYSKANDLDYFILRLPALVGKNSDYNFISKVLKRIKNNNLITFANPNLMFNNFIHVKNLTEIIYKMINLNGPAILNMAATKPMKLKKIINKIYKFEKKKNNSILIKSSSKGFNIKIDNYLKKNFNLLTTSKTLQLFLEDNKKI